MTTEIETISSPSGGEVRPGLNVTIQVHEAAAELPEGASENEVALLAAAQQWLLRLMVLGAVWTVAAVYVGGHIGSGWIPGDEGTLSQSALRVMQGQFPHRDFVEIYTGGLSFIHALAFRAFGVNLMSLRICVFLFFLAWLPAVYYIALRFTSAVGAGLVTLLTVAWSYPNYPAAMPSWYNLFFATFGAAALLRYLEVRTRRWLFLAGVCGGLSILIKVIGAYYVAAIFLFLAFLEQTDDDSGGAEETSQTSWQYRIFSVSSLLLFLAVLLGVLHARLGIAELYQFVLPSAALVLLILVQEQKVYAGSGQRFNRILLTAVPFLGGCAIPWVPVLALYGRSGAIRQFLSGVIASAVVRSSALGVIRPASVEKSLFAVVLVGLLGAASYRRELQGKLVGFAVATGLMVLLAKATTSSEIVTGVWYSAATLTPLVVVLGAVALVMAGKRSSHMKVERQRLMLLLSLAAVCSLVQYPFAAPYYLCYALPLTVLAALAVVATVKREPGNYLVSAVAGFYLLFGAVVLVPSSMYEILVHQLERRDSLRVERAGGLRIEYAANFTELIHLLQTHSPNGLMYAGNDCPELYFLAGLKNVTHDDGGAPAEEVLRAMQSDDLKLVVINEAPFYPSARMSPEVRAQVARQFPHTSRMGIFHVFWRD